MAGFSFGFRIGGGGVGGSTTTTTAGIPAWEAAKSIKANAAVTQAGRTLRNWNGDRTTDSTFTNAEADMWDLIAQTDILSWKPNQHYYVGEIASFGGRNFQRLSGGISGPIRNDAELLNWIDVDATGTGKYREDTLVTGIDPVVVGADPVVYSW